MIAKKCGGKLGEFLKKYGNYNPDYLYLVDKEYCDFVSSNYPINDDSLILVMLTNKLNSPLSKNQIRFPFIVRCKPYDFINLEYLQIPINRTNTDDDIFNYVIEHYAEALVWKCSTDDGRFKIPDLLEYEINKTL